MAVRVAARARALGALILQLALVAEAAAFRLAPCGTQRVRLQTPAVLNRPCGCRRAGRDGRVFLAVQLQASAQTDDEKREIENLRRMALQAQQQPDRSAAEARSRVQALKREYDMKAAVREKIADKARELLGRVSANPRLARAAQDSSVDDVLAKNPQVAALDADLRRLSEEIKELTRPGICSLEAPHKRHGYVREVNAAPMVAALEVGTDRARRIAERIIAADLDLRFLSDDDLAAIEAQLAAGDNAEGAMLRRTAAVMMRDFQKSIVEGAGEALAEELPAAVEEPAPLASPGVAAAFDDELLHLLRLSHYAVAAGVATFADTEQSGMLLGALERQGIDKQALRMALGAMQKRANFLCKSAAASPTSSPKCWVACHFAFLHLLERLAAD